MLFPSGGGCQPGRSAAGERGTQGSGSALSAALLGAPPSWATDRPCCRQGGLLPSTEMPPWQQPHPRPGWAQPVAPGAAQSWGVPPALPSSVFPPQFNKIKVAALHR